MTANPAEELVAIVDRDNSPIGAVSRRIMRQQQLIHRACYILVFNRQGELFIQMRTRSKDIYPGYWDLAAGGVVSLASAKLDGAAANATGAGTVSSEKLALNIDWTAQGPFRAGALEIAGAATQRRGMD